jgi:hypothetical protein
LLFLRFLAIGLEGYCPPSSWGEIRGKGFAEGVFFPFSSNSGSSKNSILTEQPLKKAVLQGRKPKNRKSLVKTNNEPKVPVYKKLNS